MATTVKVYGAGWCGDTKASRALLDEMGIAYEYHDVDKDPAAAEYVKSQNAGKQKLPTIDIDGRVLSVPGDDDLAEALENTAT